MNRLKIKDLRLYGLFQKEVDTRMNLIYILLIENLIKKTGIE